MGVNAYLSLNRNAKVISKYNHIDNNTNDNDNNRHRISRIQTIFPLIKSRKWNSKISKLSFNTNVIKKDIVGDNNFGFGVLTERAANRVIKTNAINFD